MEAIFFTISMSNLVAITVAEISKVPVYLSTVYLFDPVVNLDNATSNEPTRQLNYPIHALAYNMIHFMLFRKIGTVVRYSCRSLVYQRHYLVSIFSPRQQYLRYFSGAIFKLIVVAAPCSEYCPLSTDGNKEHNPRIATAIFSFIPETQRPVWLTFVMER